MNRERLVFEVTDGVNTPEEVTPCGGGSSCPRRRDLLFHPILKHSISLYWSLTRVNPSWPLLGVRPRIGFEYLSSANTSSELSQSSGETILVFIGCKTGGKPNR